MTPSVETAGPAAPAPEAPVERSLPLVAFERQLAPLRRIAAYGAAHPESTRYVEIIGRRWLDPLLELDLPEPLRASLILLAGQLAGIDDLEPSDRQERFRTLRTELARLDAVLGLPLPRADRPRLRRRRPTPKPSAPEAPREQERGRSSRGRGSRRRDARKASARDETRTTAEPPARKQPRRALWNGNPSVALSDLDVDEDLVLQLAEHDITTVHDLLVLRPVAERVFKPIHGAGRELPQGRIAVGGRLAGIHTVLRPDGSRTVHATLKGAGRMPLSWVDTADAERFADNVDIGQRVVVVGTWNGQSLDDAAGVVEDGKQVRQVDYGLEGVSDTALQELFFKLLPGFGDLRDPLPGALRPDGLPQRGQALLALHARGDREAALRRLAFDEVLGLSLAQCWARFADRKRGIAQNVLHTAASVLLSSIDESLSDVAEGVLDEIKRDLRRSRPMRRLLGGAPGAGKSLVALLAATAVAEGKVQVLWSTPDAQLAEAHYAFARELLEPTGLVAEYLPPGRKPDRALLDRIKRGETHLLFATHDRLGSDIAFRRLGLVVLHDHDRAVDHLGSVDGLGSPAPDVLVVCRQRPTTASLLTTWASYGLSWIDGPASPDWTIKTISHRDAAYAPARHALHNGGQCAVIFPQVNGTDALDPTEASRVLSALSSDALGGARLSLLHGAMPREDRVRTLADLAHRRVDGVVSTLPLEDLPPVPGLEVAIVEHAHRVSAHRLARIAGMGVSQVSFVVADDAPDDTSDRIAAALAGTPEPQELNEPELRFFDRSRDRDLLLQARRVALDILQVDTGLRNGNHADLLRLVHADWSTWMSDADCPLPQPGEGSRRRRRRRRRR